jgi:nitroimidazol reductase NimA-like FMN-containing flavoprotein (pyridoxamine 5'-phosphate oxidase superfamily)
MQATLTPAEILEEARALAAEQFGGSLATLHAEDGTPYVTFVLFHMRPDGSILFGSGRSPQHSRNMDATPEVSFLIDNREVIATHWPDFKRCIIEGMAQKIVKGDALYDSLVAELQERSRLAVTFTEGGALYRILPRRLVLQKGIEPARHIIDFEQER